MDKLSLVLSDGASDVRPNEESVETAEDAKHLVRILSSAQLKFKQVMLCSHLSVVQLKFKQFNYVYIFGSPNSISNMLSYIHI